eukprot:9499358-Pyramimonas_sp.AAC.1
MSWASLFNPCQFCAMSLNEVHGSRAQLCSGMPRQLREHGDYERARQKCEVILWARALGELKQPAQRLKTIESGKGIA